MAQVKPSERPLTVRDVLQAVKSGKSNVEGPQEDMEVFVVAVAYLKRTYATTFRKAFQRLLEEMISRPPQGNSPGEWRARLLDMRLCDFGDIVVDKWIPDDRFFRPSAGADSPVTRDPPVLSRGRSPQATPPLTKGGQGGSRGAADDDEIGRRPWDCSWCGQSFDIPADADEPAACPQCAEKAAPAAAWDVEATPSAAPDDQEPPLPKAALKSRKSAAVAPDPTKKPQRKVIVWSVAGCVAVGLMWFWIRPSTPPKPGDNSADAAKSAKSLLAVGDAVVIDGGAQATSIFLPTDEATWKEYEQAVTSKNDIAVDAVKSSGRGVTVTNGTRATILERGWFAFRVRIGNGEMAGRAGWVRSEFVRRDN